MAVARRENFGELLEPGLSEIFYEVYEQIPSVIGDLFNVQTTDQAVVTDLSIGTLGEFPEFDGTVEYDRMYQGYKATYEFPEYAKGFQIERKLYDDDQYNIINKRPAALAISAARKRETSAAAIFNNAFNDSYAGPDGTGLCSTTHASKATGVNQTNEGSYALNHENLYIVKLAMRGFVDDRGGKILVNPDTLLVPPAMEEDAWELIQSELKVDTADNNPNIHYGKYKLIVWDYLDDDKWFLIDSRYAKMFLNWYDRIPIEFAMEEDFDTLVAKFRAYMRFAAGWSDWVWVYGNQVSD